MCIRDSSKDVPFSTFIFFKDKMGCDVRTNSKVNNDDFSPFFDDVISDHSMAKSTMKAINAVELVRKYIKTLSEDKELSYTLYPKSKSFYSCVECNPSSFNIRRVSYDGTIEKKTFIVSSDSISFYVKDDLIINCLLYTSPSPRDSTSSRMPSSA